MGAGLDQVVYKSGRRVLLAPCSALVIPVGVGKPHIRYGGRELRHCSGCGTWRNLSKFRKGDHSDGLQGYCVDCAREYRRSRAGVVIRGGDW